MSSLRLAAAGRHGSGSIPIQHVALNDQGRQHLHFERRACDRMSTSAIGVRADAELKARWRYLRRIRLCRNRIGTIVAAVIVLSTLPTPDSLRNPHLVSGCPATTPPRRSVAGIEYAMLDEVVDQRSRSGRKVLRHGGASKLAVALLQRFQHPAMVSCRLVRPAGDGGKH